MRGDARQGFILTCLKPYTDIFEACSDYKCLPRDSPALSDSGDWTDARGHDCKVILHLCVQRLQFRCTVKVIPDSSFHMLVLRVCDDHQWYFNARQVAQSVCDNPGAAENCPTSCTSRQECFARYSVQVYFVWDRIRKIEPMHHNGSICASNDMRKSEIVQECRRWRSSGAVGSLGGRGVSAEHDKALWHWLDTVDQNGECKRASRLSRFRMRCGMPNDSNFGQRSGSCIATGLTWQHFVCWGRGG